MGLAFVNGRVFVGDGRVLEHATVLVEGNRIVKVAEGNVSVPRDARPIPLEGHTLFPGFIDCHVHLCLDGSPDPVTGIAREPLTLTALKAAEFARRTLLAGVTTVRDMGGREGVDLVLKQALQAGTIPGPRMLVSGRLICMTGGHGWPFGREADGPDEVRKAAREQIKAGVDIVKLMATGGVMTPGVEPGSEQLTEEELRAGVEEAHKAGRRTATHAMGNRGILNALRAGIDSIEHGVFLNEEAVSLMLQRDVPLVPTLSALFHIEQRGLAAGVPAYAVEKTRQVKPYHLESLKLARQAGVRIAMGTDAGTPFNLHGGNLRELKFFCERGFPTLEALQSATGVAARVLGLEKDLGTVAEGKLADLVLVAGNPLDDLELLLDRGNIRLVTSGGHPAAGQWQSLQT